MRDGEIMPDSVPTDEMLCSCTRFVPALKPPLQTRATVLVQSCTHAALSPLSIGHGACFAADTDTVDIDTVDIDTVDRTGSVTSESLPSSPRS